MFCPVYSCRLQCTAGAVFWTKARSLIRREYLTRPLRHNKHRQWGAGWLDVHSIAPLQYLTLMSQITLRGVAAGSVSAADLLSVQHCNETLC